MATDEHFLIRCCFGGHATSNFQRASFKGTGKGRGRYSHERRGAIPRRSAFAKASAVGKPMADTQNRHEGHVDDTD